MTEEWKDIFGYEGYYKISNTGKILSLERYVKGQRNNLRIQHSRLLKASINQDNYYCIVLYKYSKKKTWLIHRLVAIHFVDNPHNLEIVNHKDGNKLNCNDWNLEWCTTQQNTQHAMENNLLTFGENHGMSKLTDDIVKQIRKEYKPNGECSSYKLAVKYNVSRVLINLIVRKKIWSRA